MEYLDRWLNLALLKEPMNWAIVGVIASIWLLAMHVVMQGFGAMASPGPAIGGAGPGTISAPVATAFSAGGMLAGGFGSDLSSFVGGGSSSWVDGAESAYAEDGWTGA
jgi:hypothetical protein